MTDYAELVRRLKNDAKWHVVEEGDYLEAAAAITALAGEVERLKEKLAESEQSRDFNHAAAKLALDQRDAALADKQEPV